MPRSSLEGQVVLISGAGRGIGLACAKAVASQGGAVAMTARTQSQVEAAADAIRADGGMAQAFRADVADLDSHEPLLDQVEAACGPLTGLVNVAGLSPSLRRAEQIGVDEFDQIMNVNQRGTFFLTQAVARRLIAAGRGGSIVTISSVAAGYGLPRQVPYSMSRAAVEAMTKALAGEWSFAIDPPIRINCVAPGFISTDLTSELPPWYVDKVNNHTAMRRMGTDEEVAGAVAYLLSDSASYVTGTTINVDGGYGLWSLDPAPKK